MHDILTEMLTAMFAVTCIGKGAMVALGVTLLTGWVTLLAVQGSDPHDTAEAWDNGLATTSREATHV